MRVKRKRRSTTYMKGLSWVEAWKKAENEVE